MEHGVKEFFAFATFRRGHSCFEVPCVVDPESVSFVVEGNVVWSKVKRSQAVVPWNSTSAVPAKTQEE